MSSRKRKDESNKKNNGNVSVAENAEKKIQIKLYDNKYFYGTFNSNFSLQNKQLHHLEAAPTSTNVSVAENAEKKISIHLWNNKYFYGTFNSNFSLQNKQLQQINWFQIWSEISSDYLKN